MAHRVYVNPIQTAMESENIRLSWIQFRIESFAPVGGAESPKAKNV